MAPPATAAISVSSASSAPVAAAASAALAAPTVAAEPRVSCPRPAGSSPFPGGATSEAACGAACCGADAPLRLLRPPEALPPARQGRAYEQLIAIEGGRPPYQFTLVDGALPNGLTLGSRGLVAGTPEQPQVSRFVVAVQDRAGARLRQAFDLRVQPPPTARKAPASAPAASMPELGELTTLDAHSDLQARRDPVAITYLLPKAAFEALKVAAAGGAASDSAAMPPEGELVDPALAASAPAAVVAPPAPAASAPLPPLPDDLSWTEAQQAQLVVALEPMLKQEFPTRDLFEAAVRTRVCLHVSRVMVNEARRLKQKAPDAEDFLTRCTDPTKNPTAPSYASAAASAAAGQLPLDQVRPWLLPPGLESWLAKAARVERPLLPSKALDWSGQPGCGCAAERVDQPLYAFYPTWMNDVQPQWMNFNLINRLSVFALPLNADLARPDGWATSTAHTAFARTARRHGTKLDLALYANDWRFLLAPTAEQWTSARQRLARQLAVRTREILDTPLPGWTEDVKAWMPGFAERQYLGDGVTIMVEDLPATRPGSTRFAEFYPAFVRALAEEMGTHRERQYAINLVLTLPMLKEHAVFGVPALFELLKTVEQPTVAHGRIVAEQSDYQRGSNVELRFLVLLPEPTALSKKRLRQFAEDSPALHGTDRRVFLRSIVPVLQLPSPEAQQFQDDVVYAQDNFGGLAFWPVPLEDREVDAARREVLSNAFGPGPELDWKAALCNWICPNRWALRLLLELLLVAGAGVWVALQLNCEWRRRYGRVAMLAGLPPALVAFALSGCDPAMAFLRNGTVLLGLLVIALIVFLGAAMLKRTVEKP